MKRRTIDAAKLGDPVADRVRASHAEAIAELQGSDILDAKVFRVELPDNVSVVVAHKLGRVPKFVCVSPIIFPSGTTTGRIVENRSAPTDRSKNIVLGAIGYSLTITVDVMIW